MSDTNKWLDNYFELYKRDAFDPQYYPAIKAFYELAASLRETGNKLMFAGNGASASIASHGAVDFTKQGRVRAQDFNEPNLITCLSNDYGYENFMAKGVEFYGDAGDVVVLISVSGRSPNAVAAAKYARANHMKVVTFTGRDENNPLKALGDINFWMPSEAYNIVECTHMIWLTTVVDMLVGDAVYEVV